MPQLAVLEQALPQVHCLQMWHLVASLPTAMARMVLRAFSTLRADGLTHHMEVVPDSLQNPYYHKGWVSAFTLAVD